MSRTALETTLAARVRELESALRLAATDPRTSTSTRIMLRQTLRTDSTAPVAESCARCALRDMRKQGYSDYSPKGNAK